MNEYDCWLQERRVTSGINIPHTVFFVDELKKNSKITSQALKEYINGIKRLFGITPEVKKKPDVKMKAVFLGTISSIENEKFARFSVKKPGAEGYIIKASDTQIFIAGCDGQGLLYGVFRFLSLLALGKIENGFEISDSPASVLRMINHWDNFDGTIERGYAGNSLFYKDGVFNYSRRRIKDYARLLASIGINRISINNVNVKGKANLLITKKYLKKAAKLAAIFRCFGIRLFFSINFSAPLSLGKLPNADPLDSKAASWWKDRAELIYKYIPDLAGFIVKADSEGEPGPFQYNRTHADGANMLAEAVKPYGGIIIWRCFVYNCRQDWRDSKADRARAAYDHFMPQDGSFSANVILQIKFGPYDFQVREPVSPLFGALKKTRHVMELQITQEYTGQQIDLCYLPSIWEEIMNFDTAYGENSRIRDLVCSYSDGFAAVVNVGLDRNWTGHTLAQANLYGYGRMTWNPEITAKEISGEWSALTFGVQTAEKISGILLKSYSAYEKYNAPFGACFMVTPGAHYGPNVEGYEYSRWGTYHRADANAIGIDRTSSGTGFIDQYSRKNAALFADTSACPENLLLFFHRLRYDFKMKNGQTLLQNIYDTHFDGYDEVQMMIDEWKSLKDLLDSEVYESVYARFELQLANAREWRDQVNTYFRRKTGIDDIKGRKIYD